MTSRATVTSATPSAATIPVCARRWCSPTFCRLPATRQRLEDHYTQAIALAEMLDHANSLAHALHNGAMGHQIIGDRAATFAAADRAAVLAEKFGLTHWRASSAVLRGWATAVGSGVAEAARVIDAELGAATAVRSAAAILSGRGGRGHAGSRPRRPTVSRILIAPLRG